MQAEAVDVGAQGLARPILARHRASQRTIGNTVPNCGPRRWETKQLASPNASSVTVTADQQGTAWLLVGMDSGFESLSRIYLQRVAVTLTPTAR
jgi:hypothetical protein